MIVHPFFLVSDGHEADKWKWIAFYLFCYCSPILKVAVNTRERRFIFFNALFKIWALKGYHHTNLFIYISSFAVCLETVGSEESSFYLLPEGIPQATPHQSKITLILFYDQLQDQFDDECQWWKIQDDPPSIVANSSANSIHVSSGETNYSDLVKKYKKWKSKHCQVEGQCSTAQFLGPRGARLMNISFI